MTWPRRSFKNTFAKLIHTAAFKPNKAFTFTTGGRDNGVRSLTSSTKSQRRMSWRSHLSQTGLALHLPTITTSSYSSQEAAPRTPIISRRTYTATRSALTRGRWPHQWTIIDMITAAARWATHCMSVQARTSVMSQFSRLREQWLKIAGKASPMSGKPWIWRPVPITLRL